MALSEFDRRLLDRCLTHAPRAWEDFVDRFTGLVVHVTNHSAQARSIRLSNSDREDLIAEVFLSIIENDYAVLRRFRGQSSLATYLTVIAYRVVLRKMLMDLSGEVPMADLPQVAQPDDLQERISNEDEVRMLLDQLSGTDAQVVQLFHLEGKSYAEISQATGIPENTIGPMLSRARDKMRSGASAE